MLVATMTSREVFDVMQKDVDCLAAFSYHKEKSLMSELRKSRLEMVSQSYDYHTPNADYIIVLRCNRKGYVSRMTVGLPSGMKWQVSKVMHRLSSLPDGSI